MFSFSVRTEHINMVTFVCSKPVPKLQKRKCDICVFLIARSKQNCRNENVTFSFPGPTNCLALRSYFITLLKRSNWPRIPKDADYADPCVTWHTQRQ